MFGCKPGFSAEPAQIAPHSIAGKCNQFSPPKQHQIKSNSQHGPLQTESFTHEPPRPAALNRQRKRPLG